MNDLVQERQGMRVLMCDPAGPTVATVQDVLDLIGEAMFSAEVVAIPADRLDEQFFSLSTRFAGDVMQKFVNYRLRLAVVGDITRHLETSAALRALVHESNTADHVWFVPDVEALDARLKARSGQAAGEGRIDMPAKVPVFDHRVEVSAEHRRRRLEHIRFPLTHRP